MAVTELITEAKAIGQLPGYPHDALGFIHRLDDLVVEQGPGMVALHTMTFAGDDLFGFKAGGFRQQDI